LRSLSRRGKNFIIYISKGGEGGRPKANKFEGRVSLSVIWMRRGKNAGCQNGTAKWKVGREDVRKKTSEPLVR